MKIEDFETLVENCQMTLNDGTVQFTPYSIKDNKKVANILSENNLVNVTLEQLNEISQQNRALYQARKKLKQQQLEKYNALSPAEVAKLPQEEKVQYLELLFPRSQTMAELEEVCSQNEENIRACLFNLDFPQSFWQKEQEQADRYAGLIANSPEIVKKLQNWSNTSLDDKKDVIKQSLKIFEYVYGAVPKIEFFTEEEERERLINEGYPKDIHINGASYDKGIIRFNEDRLQSSNNLFAVSVPFHEGTHYRQDRESFGNPLIDRLFNSNANYATIYENQHNNQEDKNYKDLYTMMPFEVHAYGLQ